jgi:hypothetical protein
MLPNLKKAVFITLPGFFLLFGAGLDQFALKYSVQSQQSTEESIEIEIEIDQAIETKRHTIRKARQSSVSLLSHSKFTESTTSSGFASHATPSLQTNRYLLYRSLLI